MNRHHYGKFFFFERVDDKWFVENNDKSNMPLHGDGSLPLAKLHCGTEFNVIEVLYSNEIRSRNTHISSNNGISTRSLLPDKYNNYRAASAAAAVRSNTSRMLCSRTDPLFRQNRTSAAAVVENLMLWQHIINTINMQPCAFRCTTADSQCTGWRINNSTQNTLAHQRCGWSADMLQF